MTHSHGWHREGRHHDAVPPLCPPPLCPHPRCVPTFSVSPPPLCPHPRCVPIPTLSPLPLCPPPLLCHRGSGLTFCPRHGRGPPVPLLHPVCPSCLHPPHPSPPPPPITQPPRGLRATPRAGIWLPQHKQTSGPRAASGGGRGATEWGGDTNHHRTQWKQMGWERGGSGMPPTRVGSPGGAVGQRAHGMGSGTGHTAGTFPAFRRGRPGIFCTPPASPPGPSSSDPPPLRPASVSPTHSSGTPPSPHPAP